MIVVEVPGKPAPGGSKRAFVIPGTNRASVTDDAKGNADWKARVARFARDAYRGPLLDEPLVVAMTFTVARPKGHFGTGRNADVLKPSAPPRPTTKPDVLKLARSTEDALTGVIWKDDCTTIRLILEKRYGDDPGVRVEVRTLSAIEAEGRGECA